MLQRAFPKANASLPHLTVACAVYQAMGRPEQAAYYARQATRVAPADADMWANLGLMLFGVPAPTAAATREAESAYRKALSLGPPTSNTVTGLANLLLHQRRFAEGESLCRTAQVPLTAALAATYSSLLAALWRTDEAVATLRAAVEASPTDPALVQALIVNLQVTGPADPLELPRLHRRLGGLVEQSAPRLPQRTPHATDRDRRLVVGFVSPDLRRHSVASFVCPLFKALDRAQFEVRAYSTSPHQDEVSALLRRNVDGWVDASRMSDHALAMHIAKDRVDILIDLAGLSQGGRLGLLARKPAPLQGTYCGYPDTTGVSSVDIRIVDAITDPPGPADALPTERLVRLAPCFLCYQPPTDAPDIEVRDQNLPVIFGTFNTLRKVNGRTLDLWHRVLERTPGSRLFIKALDLDLPEVASRLRSELDRRGLGTRVDVLTPPKAVRDHLAQYALVDIALDTFPYHGTTTTCEALWMGVPVVTLTGEVHASRVSTSLLHAIGHGHWAARSEDEYVALATSLASDRPVLSAIRAGLRDEFRKSPLRNEHAFGKEFGSMLRAEWSRMCGE